MKKTFKKLLKPVLAATMALSLFGVMSVTASASYLAPAENEVFVWYGNPTLDNSGADNDTGVFDVGVSTSSSTSSTLASSQTVTTSGGDVYTVTGRTGSTASDTRTITITVPETVTSATLYFVGQSSSSATRTLTLTASDDSMSDSISLVGNTASTLYSKTGLAEGTYTITASSNYQIGMLLLDIIEVNENATVSTKYDETSFGTQSTETTIAVPDTSAVTDSLTGNEVYNIAVAAGESVRSSDDSVYALTTAGTYASDNENITLNTSGEFWVDSSSTATTRKIYTGGKGRTITVNLGEGEAVLLTNYVSGSSSDSTRYLTLDGVNYYAPTSAADTIMTVSAAGEYSITSSANVSFTAISIIGTSYYDAPEILISDESVDGDIITYIGTITDSTDEEVTITGINFVVAPGFTTEEKTAKSYEITEVYAEGSTYTFTVAMDASNVSNMPGLKVQANIKTNGGTLYSAYDEYVPNTTA